MTISGPRLRAAATLLLATVPLMIGVSGAAESGQATGISVSGSGYGLLPGDRFPN